MNEKDLSGNQPTEPSIAPADDCTYHFTKDQLPSEPLEPTFPTQTAKSGTPPGVSDFPHPEAPQRPTPISPVGEPAGTYTGAYAYTTAPESVSAQKKKNRTPLFICIAALAVIVCTLSGIVGGAVIASRGGTPGTPHLNSPVVTDTVVKVNNGEIPQSILMQAAADAFHSVVVIDTFASQNAVDANEASGAGSGVIWTENGYIITCNHVIDGFTLIRVTLSDGTSYFADVVGTDPQTDLAVLKVSAKEKLPAATVRGTDLILAETVIAIGNPLGVLSNTVTSGILSSLTREIRIEGQIMSLLQIDAAVNHGNSGGGLFDVNGSLIGIVNAKSTGESVEGIGFAIPITTVNDVCTQLIQQGYVTGRPQLGIEVVTVNQANASTIFGAEYYPDLKPYATTTYKDAWGRERTQIVEGVYIINSSAVKGYANGEELKYGDLILYVGENEISTNADVLEALSHCVAGDTLSVTIQRDHKTVINVEVILGQKGAKN